MSKSKEEIIKTDFDGNLIKCPHCNFITGKRSKAVMHILNEHRKLRKGCPICGYKTKNMEDVMNHHSTYHKNLSSEDLNELELKKFIKIDKESLNLSN